MRSIFQAAVFLTSVLPIDKVFANNPEDSPHTAIRAPTLDKPCCDSIPPRIVLEQLGYPSSSLPSATAAIALDDANPAGTGYLPPPRFDTLKGVDPASSISLSSFSTPPVRYSATPTLLPSPGRSSSISIQTVTELQSAERSQHTILPSLRVDNQDALVVQAWLPSPVVSNDLTVTSLTENLHVCCGSSPTESIDSVESTLAHVTGMPITTSWSETIVVDPRNNTALPGVSHNSLEPQPFAEDTMVPENIPVHFPLPIEHIPSEPEVKTPSFVPVPFLSTSVTSTAAEFSRSYVLPESSELGDETLENLQRSLSRLTMENVRLAKMLEEEREARRISQSAQIGGVEAMWTKFQNTVTVERENYARLEESHNALLAQQNAAQRELNTQRIQVREFAQVKKQLQSESAELRGQLEVARKDVLSLKRQLQKGVQEVGDGFASSATQSELQSQRDSIRRLREDNRRLQSEYDGLQLRYSNEVRSCGVLKKEKEHLETKIEDISKTSQTSTSQVRDLTQTSKQLQSEVAELRAQLEVAKNEASDTKRQLQRLMQEEDKTSAEVSQLRNAIETCKAKELSYEERLEVAEMTQVKADRDASSVRRTLAEAEMARSENAIALNAAEDRLKIAERRMQELQVKLDEQDRQCSEVTISWQRVSEELEIQREQFQKDFAERDFAVDQTRKKYQAELSQMSEEVQSQRDSISRLREDNSRLRSDCDELHLRYDDAVYNCGSWKKENERMEIKLGNISNAYETSLAAQAEQQSQIATLHSQVKELRGVLDDAEADRALLQKARRVLQAELETFKLDHVGADTMSSERLEYQRLQFKKQELERSLEEKEDRINNAFDRMKKAEAYANECQVELGKVRVENSELDRLNANLEKQTKDLNVKIVDFETRSYANSPRAPTTSWRTESRAEDATSQVYQSQQGRSGTSRLKATHESNRPRTTFEEERRAYEAQLQSLHQAFKLGTEAPVHDQSFVHAEVLRS